MSTHGRYECLGLSTEDESDLRKLLDELDIANGRHLPTSSCFLPTFFSPYATSTSPGDILRKRTLLHCKPEYCSKVQELPLKLLELLFEKMEKSFQSQLPWLVCHEIPWTWILNFENNNRTTITNSSSFMELHRMLISGNDSEPIHPILLHDLASYVNGLFITSMVDTLVSISSGHSALRREIHRPSELLPNKLVDYDLYVLNGESESWTAILNSLYTRTFSRHVDFLSKQISPGQFASYISGQIEHSLTQRFNEKRSRQQEEEAKRTAVERKQLMEEERKLEAMHEEDLKTKAAKAIEAELRSDREKEREEWYDAIDHAYYGSVIELSKRALAKDKVFIRQMLERVRLTSFPAYIKERKESITVLLEGLLTRE